MKIAIINQPTNNRGDESAHKGLMRSLLNRYPNHQFQVLFFGESEDSVNQMKVQGENIEYFCIPPFRGITRLSMIAMMLSSCRLLLNLHPQFRQIKRRIKDSNLIINAPGGICMGLFQNWNHLFWLQTAKIYKKPIAYYSRSFGPFPTGSFSNRIFKRISDKLLHNFDFLSIRDEKTMKLAKEMGLEFVPSIDSAFLEAPCVQLPDEVTKTITTDNYIVFVPNSLTWQPAYKKSSESEIFAFYDDLVKIMIKRYPDSAIVMMPQLFNSGNRNDVIYFEQLKRKSKHNEKIIVLPDSHSSDIQQTIISKAKFVVGARYHSIVFAINNSVPFVALSYEHKMVGLLSLLNRSERQIDISSIGINGFEKEHSLSVFTSLINDLAFDNDETKNSSYLTARNCFEELCHNFIDKNYCD